MFDDASAEREDDVADGDAAEVGSRPGVEARPVSSLWILGTMSLLLVMAGAVAFLMMPRGSVLELAEAREELFESVADPLPYGLVATEARRLPSRELVLTYVLPADAGPDGAAAPSDSPMQVTFMQFPEQRAESVLEDQFQKLRFETAGAGRGGGGRGGGGSYGGGSGQSGGSSKPKLQDAGFLDWQGFSANYARLRHTVPSDEAEVEPGEEPGEEPEDRSDAEPKVDVEQPDETAPGSALSEGEKGPKEKSKTYDTVRVNLSTGGRCIIAYVRFPVGATGSKEAVGELLGSFEPLR